MGGQSQIKQSVSMVPAGFSIHRTRFGICAPIAAEISEVISDNRAAIAMASVGMKVPLFAFLLAAFVSVHFHSALAAVQHTRWAQLCEPFSPLSYCPC